MIIRRLFPIAEYEFMEWEENICADSRVPAFEASFIVGYGEVSVSSDVIATGVVTGVRKKLEHFVMVTILMVI